MIDIFATLQDLGRRQRIDPARISVIVMNRSGPAHRAVAMLAFVDGGVSPLAFVKATGEPGRAEALRREFDNLSALHDGGTDAFRRTIPEPLYCEVLDGVTLLAESATPGTRMKNFPPNRYFASPRFRDHFSQSVRWLVDFRSALVGDANTGSIDAASEIRSYRDHHDVSATLSALLDDTVAVLEGITVPLAPSHGDFCTANIVVAEDDTIRVIDWEYPLGRTWPVSDLLYFICSTWCVPYRKGGEALEANYRRLFFAPHSYTDLIRESSSWYARQLGLPTDLLLPLSVASWAAFANRKRSELAAAGEDADEAGHMPLIMTRDRRCLNLEVLAELRERYILTGI